MLSFQAPQALMKKIMAANIQEVLASNKPSGKISFTFTIKIVCFRFFVHVLCSLSFCCRAELKNHGKFLLEQWILLLRLCKKVTLMPSNFSSFPFENVSSNYRRVSKTSQSAP